MISVSRESGIWAAGLKLCSRCGRRLPRKNQSWCKPCHTEYCRERRAGKIERLLTPQEWEDVLAARAAAAAPGRHRADR